MKKFAALVLTLILTLTTLSSAFAASNVGSTTTPENTLTFEMVRMAIASNGKIAAKMSAKDSNGDLKVYNGDIVEMLDSITKAGGIIRAKGMIPGKVDENYFLADGSTYVELALEVVNAEQLAEALMGKAINAVNVVDGTAIFTNTHIGHMCVGSPKNLVAKLHQKNGGMIINVYYELWDGAKHLVLDADAVYSSNNGGDTPNGDNGDNGDNNQTDNGSNEPDPTLRDRNPVSSSTTSSSSSSSNSSSSSSSTSTTSEPNPGLRGR